MALFLIYLEFVKHILFDSWLYVCLKVESTS